MDAALFDSLAERLIRNPQDADALAQAHHAGQREPVRYAAFLERVATGANEAALAAHWFGEAAQVWEALGDDAHRRRLLAHKHEALAHALGAGPEADPAAALAHWDAVVALEPGHPRALREVHARRPDDLAAGYAFACSVLERLSSERVVGGEERVEATRVLVRLAEAYEGEPSMRYALAALRIAPGEDRAIQIVDHRAQVLGVRGDLVAVYRSYLSANPSGVMAPYVRDALALLDPPWVAGLETTPPVAAAAEIPTRPVPLLEQARSARDGGDVERALTLYGRVLEDEPLQVEAFEFVTASLRRLHRFDALFEVASRAAASAPSAEERRAHLEEVAAIAESLLHDVGRAIEAWRAIVALAPTDRTVLRRLAGVLERAERWDDWAETVERQVSGSSDTEERIGLLRRLAQVHERDRRDRDAACRAWIRVSELDPGDVDSRMRAAILAEESGDPRRALDLLEQASLLDAADDALSDRVRSGLERLGDRAGVTAHLLRRADRLADPSRRSELRHRAAELQRAAGDEDGARRTFELIAGDGDDVRALQHLFAYAEQRGDAEALVLLGRRIVAHTTGEVRLAYAIHVARTLSESVGDFSAAIGMYRRIVEEFDPRNAFALHAWADLEIRSGRPAIAASALESLAAVLDSTAGMEESHRSVLRRLFELYAGPLGDEAAAVRVLERIVAADPSALDAVAWLAEVHARSGNVDGLARCIARLNEAGTLGSGALTNDAARRAFDVLMAGGRRVEAQSLGWLLVRNGHGGASVAGALESLALEARDFEGLALLFEIRVRDLEPDAKALECVRQAEILATSGADALDAVRHGEAGLAALDPGTADALVDRLAALCVAPGHRIDLLERQVLRCRTPEQRLHALGRAIRVAAANGAFDRVRDLVAAGLGESVLESSLAALEATARDADRASGSGPRVLGIVADAVAAVAHASPEGGRTRAALLHRAASLAMRELGDEAVALRWLGDAVAASADDASLDALAELATRTGQARHHEEALTRALGEIYDEPSVRRLLRRRASVRRHELGDARGAVEDLRRLIELGTDDPAMIDELAGWLTGLGDHRGTIDLYERAILRSNDPAVRIDHARQVARILEDTMGDAREAAEAWRRVLRLNAGDAEAKQGLDRTKRASGQAVSVVPPPVATRRSTVPPPPVSLDVIDLDASSVDLFESEDPVPPAPPSLDVIDLDPESVELTEDVLDVDPNAIEWADDEEPRRG